jgi:hypothetical protein
MFKDCDLLFSKILGVTYFYSRFLVNLLLFISIYGNSLIYTRIIASVLAVFTTIGMYLLLYMPAKVSTEAHRCFNTTNSINVRNKIPIPTKLKVRLFFKIVLKIDLMSCHFYCQALIWYLIQKFYLEFNCNFYFNFIFYKILINYNFVELIYY